MIKNRYLLSVIIPCYNSRNSIRILLDSCLLCGYLNDVEFIIVDDRSPDNFYDVLKKYYGKINFKYIKTKKDVIHCPGNTRLAGLSVATGKWVMFIDHDDKITNLFFSYFKCVFTNINDTNIVKYDTEIWRGTDNYNNGYYINDIVWLHGNIYNNKFIKEHGISFMKDLLKQEDEYFNLIFSINTVLFNKNYITINNYHFYKWLWNPNSLSNTNDYRFTLFPDYLKASFEPYITYNTILQEKYEQRENIQSFIKHTILRAFALYCIHNSKFNHINKEYIDIFKLYYKKVLNILKINHNEFLKNITFEDIQNSWESMVEVGDELYLHYLSIKYFLNSLVNKKYKLSIIVPCYNSKPYIKLLLNNLNNLNNIEDIEIILVDDYSTDNFILEVRYDIGLINAYYIKTNKDDVHGPGNARSYGINYINTDWCIFLDHDDYIFNNSIDIIYSLIEPYKENKDVACICTDFYFRNLDNTVKEIITKNNDISNFVHGNIYNVKFLKEYNINFSNRYAGYEDIYFNNLILCNVINSNKKLINASSVLNMYYNWIDNENSLSDKNTNEYWKLYYKDYINSTLTIFNMYTELYNNYVYFNYIILVILKLYEWYCILITEYKEMLDLYIESLKYEVTKFFKLYLKIYTYDNIMLILKTNVSNMEFPDNINVVNIKDFIEKIYIINNE